MSPTPSYHPAPEPARSNMFTALISGALIAPETLGKELANHAPVLLMHGEADDVVPAQRSRDAEAALRALRVPVEAVYVPRLGHGIDDTGISMGALTLQRVFAS